MNFAASYKYDENLTFIFEGINLTDEYSDRFIDSIGDRARSNPISGTQPVSLIISPPVHAHASRGLLLCAANASRNHSRPSLIRKSRAV